MSTIKTLGEVATYINGRAFKPTEWEEAGKPIIRIQNLNNDNAQYHYSSKMYDERFLVKKGDLLFSWSGSLGVYIWSGRDAWLNQHIFRVIPNEGIDKHYLFNYLQTIIADLYAKAHGSGMIHITKGPFMSTPIPIPSMAEQKRIVVRIEELLSQLNASVNELKTAKERLKVYRQAVLKEALDSVRDVCEITTIQSVCEDIKVGIVIKPTQYYVDSDGVRAFRNANVRRDFIEDTDWAMISKDGHKKSKRSEVHTGDVLIARSGVNLGMAAAVPERFDGYNAIDVVIAVPKQECILSKYLAYYTNSPYGINSVKENQRGVAQGHLNVKVYRKLPLMLPLLEQQEQVVSKIEERLSVCDGIEKTVNAALQQAEALRQSILKKAFEGGL